MVDGSSVVSLEHNKQAPREGGFFSSLDSMIAAIGDSETLWQIVPTISCRQKRVLLSEDQEDKFLPWVLGLLFTLD